MLPWGSHKGPIMLPPDSDLRPGEFVMRLLFTEFTVQAERKMEAVMAEPQVSELNLFEFFEIFFVPLPCMQCSQ